MSHFFPGRSTMSFLCPAHISQLPSTEIELGETEVCSSAREKTVPRRCSMFLCAGDELVGRVWTGGKAKPYNCCCFHMLLSCGFQYILVLEPIFLKTSGEFFEVFEMTGTGCLLSPLFFPWRNPKPVVMPLWHTYIENPELLVINAGNPPNPLSSVWHFAWPSLCQPACHHLVLLQDLIVTGLITSPEVENTTGRI